MLHLLESGQEIPTHLTGLTRKLIDPDMVDVLASCGIAVERPRTKDNRLIRLSKITTDLLVITG